MRSNYNRIGDHIELVDKRNKDLAIDLLLGLSISKQFIPSVANTIGTNMKNYKIIRKGQFACSIMQVRRDGKMPIALLEDFDEAIISQAYPVFKVIDETKLLPEFLMMWFSRSEFDRQATFHAVGGVRGSLDWDDFLDFELPITSIEKQQEIVNEYNTIARRITLNQQLNQKLGETAQVLYKHWFVDFEFPNEEGNSYKSSDGKMVFNAELDKEIPEGWYLSNISDLMTINYGKSLPERKRIPGPVKVYSSAGVTGWHNSEITIEESIIIGRKGSIGTLYLELEPMFCIDTAYFIKMSDSIFPLEYTFLQLKQLDLPSLNEDSAVPGLSRETVYNTQILKPEYKIVERFSKVVGKYTDYKKVLGDYNKSLISLSNIILSKMTKVEVGKEKKYSYEV